MGEVRVILELPIPALRELVKAPEGDRDILALPVERRAYCCWRS
jgi:hypothetical protein